MTSGDYFLFFSIQVSRLFYPVLCFFTFLLSSYHISTAETQIGHNVTNANKLSVRVQLGHSNWVNSVALSPDADLVVSGGVDHTARIWNRSSGRELRVLRGHSKNVSSVAFSPDGKLVVTASFDSTVRLWEVSTGEQIRQFKGHAYGVTSVSFSPDGGLVAGGGVDNNIRIWAVSSGDEVQTLQLPGDDQAYGAVSLAFSPDGKYLLTGSSGHAVWLWEISSGKVLKTFEHPSKDILSVAFSPDGRQFATAGNSSPAIRTWDISSGAEITSFAKDSRFASAVAYSPDGKYILASSSGRFSRFSKSPRLWNITTGEEVLRFEGHDDGVLSLAFSLDGNFIVTGGKDNTARLWDAASGKEIRSFGGFARNVTDIALSHSGKHLLTGGQDQTARLWNLETGYEVRGYTGLSGSVSSIAFSSDDKLVLAGSKNIAQLLDVQTGKQVGVFKGHTNSIESVAFSPTDQQIATSGFDIAARLWDVASENELRRFEKRDRSNDVGEQPVPSVIFDPTGRYVATAHWDETARLWDVSSGEEIRTFKGHSSMLTSVAFSQDGKYLVSGSWDDSARLWEVSSGKSVRVFNGDDGHSKAVSSVAISPDSRYVATGSLDGTVRLWDVPSGTEINRFDGHLHEVNSVAFSLDGEHVLTGSIDGTARLWDAATGRELVQFVSFTDGSWVAITPEGFFNASGDGPKHINVVRGLEVFSVDQVYDALFRPDLVREALVGDPNGKVAAAAAELNLEKIIEGGFPPRLSLVSPEAEETIPGDGSGTSSVTVEVDIEATTGGIGKVEWAVNGVLQDVSERGLAPLVMADDLNGTFGNSTVGEVKRVSQSLYLAPGENLIEVVAYNAAGLIASAPLTFNVILDEPEITDPKLYVLSVGVNDYLDSRLNLTYAAPDARAIGKALKAAGKEIYSDIIVETMLDKDVTKKNLEAAFERLEDEVRPGDVFVFFVAGHGKTEDGRYYFIPHDFRYSDESSFKTHGIGQSILQEWFAKVRAQKSVLLFDTCQSGTLTQEPVQRGTEELAAISRLNRAIGRTTLTASTDTAPALEGYRGHGLFTYTLLDAIAAADNDQDSAVDVTELASYIDRRLPEYSEAAFGYTQVPQMKVVGNTFPLALATVVLSDKPTQVISKTPTHVVIQQADVLQEAIEDAAVVTRLQPGTSVRLLSSATGWVLIARDGEVIGYVADTTLLALQ